MPEYTRAEMKDLLERIVCACDNLMPLKAFKDYCEAERFCTLIAEAAVAVGGQSLIAKRGDARTRGETEGR